MESRQRYKFGKNEKLKSRKQIELLFKSGKSFSVFPLRVVYLLQEREDVALQAGFSVSTRYFKKAVDRNRIKRLMREAFRLQKSDLDNASSAAGKKMIVFFIYTGNELPDYALIYEKMTTALKRLQKNSHENAAATN